MDVVTFMLAHLCDLKVDKTLNLAYAPYIMAFIKAKTRFTGRCEAHHTLFRPFKNDMAFHARDVTPFPDVEPKVGNAGDAGDADDDVDPIPPEQQMPTPPPSRQQQFWQPPQGYFDPYFTNMQQNIGQQFSTQFQTLQQNITHDFTQRIDAGFEAFGQLVQLQVYDPLMQRLDGMQTSL